MKTSYQYADKLYITHVFININIFYTGYKTSVVFISQDSQTHLEVMESKVKVAVTHKAPREGMVFIQT